MKAFFRSFKYGSTKFTVGSLGVWIPRSCDHCTDLAKKDSWQDIHSQVYIKVKFGIEGSSCVIWSCIIFEQNGTYGIILLPLNSQNE